MSSTLKYPNDTISNKTSNHNLEKEFNKLIKDISEEVIKTSVHESLGELSNVMEEQIPRISNTTQRLEQQTQSLESIKDKLKDVELAEIAQNIEELEVRIDEVNKENRKRKDDIINVVEKSNHDLYYQIRQDLIYVIGIIAIILLFFSFVN